MWTWLRGLPCPVSASTDPAGSDPSVLVALPEDFMMETLAKLELDDLDHTSYWGSLCDQAAERGYGTQETANFAVGVILAGRAIGKLGLRTGRFAGKQAGTTTASEEFIATAIKTARQAHPAAEDSYVIKWASEKGHTGVVKLLLHDARADPSAKDNYGIKWASRNGHGDIVKLLLDDSRVDSHQIDV